MVGALLKCEDTHAWLASDKGEADLFISKELQQTYFEAHRLRLGVTRSTFLSHYWTRDIRPKVLEEVHCMAVAENQTILPWFIRSSLPEATPPKINVLMWTLQERRRAEGLGTYITGAQGLTTRHDPVHAKSLQKARTELAEFCGQTTGIMETLYTRGLVAVAKVPLSTTHTFPLPSQHAQLVYRDPGLTGAKDATENGLADWAEDDDVKGIELPVEELGAIGLDGANSIDLEGYLEAVKEDALGVLRGNRLGPLLATQLHKVTGTDALDGVESTTAFGPTHWRNTLRVLGNIYRDSSSSPSSKVLIKKILVLGAFRLLSSNYGLYSIMFVQLLELAFLTSSCPREELF